MTYLVLILASLWAGMQNALAGGGSFITLPSLMLTGMDARAANITSTVALFPAQIATGLTGRKMVAGAGELSFRALVVISLIGGALGACLLLITPPAFFAHLVPWLVLFATGVFAYGSFVPRKKGARRLNRFGAGGAQLCISIYGGYFGGGIGFLMLAALTATGLAIRSAGATKNVLAAVMNASAVVIFVFSPEVRWVAAALASIGAITGGVLGGLMLQRVNERALRVVVIMIGIALTVGLFVRSNSAVADTPPAAATVERPWKLTLGDYRYSGDNNYSNFSGGDVNLRWRRNDTDAWVGVYSDRVFGTQGRVGADTSINLTDSLQLQPSLQLATQGFVGGSVNIQAGGAWFGIAGIGRTNLKPYFNLNFDPNDALTFGVGHRASDQSIYTLFVVADDRLHTHQKDWHLNVRIPVHAMRATLDILRKSGLSDAGPITAWGFSATWDWPTWFLRAARDPYQNFSAQSAWRLATGVRF